MLLKHVGLYEECPKLYRAVKFDYMRNKYTVAPFGLHWPIRLLIRLWERSYRYKPTLQEQHKTRIHTLEQQVERLEHENSVLQGKVDIMGTMADILYQTMRH